MTQKFPIREIVLNQRCQARVEPHPDIVDEYAAAYRSKAKMPPVDVFIVDGAPHLIDGWHRISGAIKAEATWITCEIVGTGTLEEAVWKALAANQTHGIRRTNEDKRRAVRLALESPIGNEQSNRVIAEHVGVGDQIVASVRAEFEASRRAATCVNHAPEPVKRTGKDGKSYTVKPKAPKPKLTIPSTDEPEPVAVDYPVEDDAPLPHEPEYDALPNYGENLLKAAEIIKKARLDALSIALPNSYAQDVRSGLRDAESRLRLGVPEVCPKCNGAKCNRCQNRGWCERGQADGMRRTDKVLGR